MKASKLLVLALCVVVIGSGCRTMENIGIALHESIDAALSNKVDHLPAVTNMVPGAGQPDAAQGCGCDLTAPVCDPPYTPLWLDQQGNDTECPLPHGMDIRGKCLYPSINQRYSLHILKHLVSGKDAQGMIQGKCATVEGYRYHFLGYAHNRDKDPVTVKPGEPFPYKTTTMVWHDCRKAK